MTTKVESNVALTAAGTTEGGQAAAEQLTDAEVKKLTDETVELLLKTGGGEAREWIDKGRIIDGYVERLQPKGKFSKPNPFTLLAEREDMPWHASQLRTYRDAYLFWRKVGGEDGETTDVTTVGLVLGLGEDEARKILKRAAKDKLTTRQVAALVKKVKGVSGTEKPERVAGDWKLLGKALDAIESELSLMLECPPVGMAALGVVDRLEIVLKSIQDLLAKVSTPECGAQ